MVPSSGMETSINGICLCLWWRDNITLVATGGGIRLPWCKENVVSPSPWLLFTSTVSLRRDLQERLEFWVIFILWFTILMLSSVMKY